MFWGRILSDTINKTFIRSQKTQMVQKLFVNKIKQNSYAKL